MQVTFILRLGCLIQNYYPSILGAIGNFGTEENLDPDLGKNEYKEQSSSKIKHGIDSFMGEIRMMRKKMSIGYEKLCSKDYPGRVIIIGADSSGESVVVIYAITGRSPSSQARRIERTDNSILVKPADPELIKKGNLDLLIYPAVILSQGIAVSNGKQTKDVRSHLGKSQSPMEVLKYSLRKWDYEPDAPTFTPRISGCVLKEKKAALSIIKRTEAGTTRRSFFDIPLIAGKAKMIATYSGENLEPLPSFSGEPEDVELAEKNPESTAEAVYEAMKPQASDKDYRVAAVCIFSKDLKANRYEIAIINRHERRKK